MSENEKGRIVLQAAEEEWTCNIHEPPGNNWKRIDIYIRGGKSRLGIAWSWLQKAYRRNRSFEWCGAFAAYCYSIAGVTRKNRVKHFASCYRLWKWSGGRHANSRRVDNDSLQPGDVVVMGPRGHVRGKHIAICEKIVGRKCHTFEGNAHGRFPDGEFGEGVVRCERPLRSGKKREYRILYGVRPLPEDYE